MKIQNILILAMVFALMPAQQVVSQELRAPEYFKKLSAKSTTVEKAISEAARRADGQDEFWLGYQFQLRDDIDFHDVTIHDDGGIHISRGGHYTYHDDDDERTVALRALSEQGDEQAKQELAKLRRPFVSDDAEQWGVFYRVKRQDKTVQQIRLFNFRSERKFRRLPVFWAEVNADASFEFLKRLAESAGHRDRVVEPAIFVLSMHEHDRVVSLLTQMAAGGRHLEIRKTAAFWLGQIPRQESLDALIELYARESNGDMKKKLIFSIGQHETGRALQQLTKIAKTDADFNMREKAIFWIGQRKDNESLDLLQDMMKNTTHARLKEKLIFSISQHDSERAVPILIEVAEHDRSREARQKAIFWLGQMAGKRTLEALGGIVETDPETEIKTKAVFAISQHENEKVAADMLVDIARSNSNAEVRRKAMFWLGQMGDERAVSFFKEILTK